LFPELLVLRVARMHTLMALGGANAIMFND
jgi:hypothetical protein